METNIRLGLTAAAVVMDIELGHIDFEQVYLLTDIESDIYIELPE